MEIAIDFDGTCTTHEFPKIGKDIGAIPVLKELVNNGHKLILFTMRADREVKGETGHPDILDEIGLFLTDAINWFKINDIPLYGIQSNPTQKNWTTSPKCYAQLYIDDAALGCPLKQDYISHPDGHYAGEPVPDGRPYVDWDKVRELLIIKNLISIYKNSKLMQN